MKYKFKPYSKNIIFLDTEFSSMDPYKGEILNPEAYFPKDKENFFRKIGVDASKYKLHNALDDAKLLRAVYLKMTGVAKGVKLAHL